MTGLIDIGGGLRDIYGAGVLDRCIDYGITFEHCIGVSAGSANIASFLAGQRGRNYVYYTEYAFRPQYMSFGNLLRCGSYVDMEYIYGTLTNQGGEYPLDFEKMISNPAEFCMLACDAGSGETVCIDKHDMKLNDYFGFKASCSIPVLNRPWPVGNRFCFDGGMCDPIPVRRLAEQGCDRIVLILTRPKDYFREPSRDRLLADLLSLKYPAAGKKMAGRSALYNEELKLALEYEKQGRLLIVAPSSIEGLDTLTRNRQKFITLYEMGLRDAESIPGFLAR